MCETFWYQISCSPGEGWQTNYPGGIPALLEALKPTFEDPVQAGAGQPPTPGPKKTPDDITPQEIKAMLEREEMDRAVGRAIKQSR